MVLQIHQKKMEEIGIIEGSRFIVKPSALGFQICAFIGITLDNAHQYKSVVKEIEKIPEVIECHFITGPDSTWSSHLNVSGYTQYP